MRPLFNWLDDRTGYRNLMHHALYEPIPGGARWRYVWGSTLVFTFSLQVLTGVLLWMAYSPSGQTAWESVYYIQYQMHWGWLIRGMHHFAAQAMVVLLGLHFLQVVVDGAYKAPREVNFWLGIVLMQIVLGLSLTGYLLPWDQKGYYATQVATKIMGVTPGVGSDLQTVVQGGPEYGHHTLTRFFALHAGVLPGLLVLFLVLHVYVFRRHAITPADPRKYPKFAVGLTLLFGPSGMFYANAMAAILMAAIYGAVGWGLWWTWGEYELSGATAAIAAVVLYFVLNAVFSPLAARSAREFEQTDAHFWPDQVLKDAVACLAVLATVMGLALYFHGAELTAPANPAEQFEARPEWYFLFLFRFLKFESVGRMGEVFGAIIVPGIIMAVIVLMPLVGRWKLGHRFNVAFTMALLLGAGWLTGLAMYEDWNNAEYQAAKLTAHHDAERAIALASAHGIPVEGARELLLSDPLTQGPRIFKKQCSGCHHYNQTDGLGGVPLEKPTAADLGNFGSRAWIRAVITDYAAHFAPLERAQKEVDGEMQPVGYLSGEMKDFSESNRTLFKAHPEGVTAVVEFLFAQAPHPEEPAPDAKLVAQGRELFTSSEWPGGSLTLACGDCHGLTPAGETEPLSESGADYYPDLTGYGGPTWLRKFLDDPTKFYGENNAMTGYHLSPKDMDLLTRWMTHDYESLSAASDEE